MGCSNARLLVQAPSATETGARTNNPLLSSTEGTSPTNVPIDTTTRMHLTGVDLVVERNGSYTLLLTPKTHKQLMPYVLRKKRFRILVDKPRSELTVIPNEQIMESNKELKLTSEKDKTTKQTQMNESTVESIEQIASDELNKVESRLLCGRSIDRGNPDDEDEYIQSDDEGMIEEIITTVEQDKDLECKVKKKIETKKTMSQHPDTHDTITKVVKTEVTEITRTITLNDHHDIERAKRELGIDAVNKLLPSSTWTNQSHGSEIKEKQDETKKELITSKDLSSNSQIKQIQPEKKFVLSESTTVGRGPVNETILSSSLSVSSSKSEQKPIEIKKKKKKSKFCSCTRSTDDEHKKESLTKTPIEQIDQISTVKIPVVQSVMETQIQGQQLISSDIKQLIIDKKFLLIEYIHSKIFAPSKLLTSNEDDIKARKISSRILDLLRYDRCSSWTQMFEQLTDEYANYLPANLIIQPMINTYESLFTNKQSNLLNTFSTIHNENDIKNIQENNDYITIVENHIDERDNQPTIGVLVQQSVDNIENTLENLQKTSPDEQVEKVTNDDEQLIRDVNMTNDIQQSLPVYNEEQLIKMLAEIPQHKPVTLAEAIAYEYIDIEDPKLGLSNDTIQYIKNLFRPLSDQSASNLIRIQRSGKYLTDINLAETNPFEKFNITEPYIYQLQQLFEPILDFNENQFRLLTETILKNKEQYDQLQFDIAPTSLPIYDMKESSTNDFSQSDSGYSMTTATHESLASKIKIEFEPINQDIPTPPIRSDLYEEEKIDLDKATQEQLDKYELNQDLIQLIKLDFNASDKTIGQAILSRELRLDSTDPSDIMRLHSLGIHKEQARILTAFFFPKHTRIIAYSPEPGRFVEAQTTYNPDYPSYKTDTTIIQIQEKQLSSDHLAKQRNIHDDRASPILSEQITQSETIVPVSSSEISPIIITKEKLPSPPPSSPPPTSPPPPPPITTTATAAPIKKRKSSGSLLACFKSKKPKAGTEQQGQATIQSTTAVSETNTTQQPSKPSEEKPIIDYSVTQDGKRIYIDAFRDRPGLDMSYKPNDFENRFVLPIAKPASEYEQPIPHEIEPITFKPKTIEHEPMIHLEPRSPVIEPVDVQPEKTPIIVPLTKTDEMIITKKPTIDLHGAAVKLPDIELVQPGPLPTLSIKKKDKTKKVKKSTGGLCASCFSTKAKEKKKQKESISETIQAPMKQKKITEIEKKEDLPSTVILTTQNIEPPSLSSTTVNEPILPKVNIDIFKERNFQKSAQNFPQPEQRLDVTIEKIIPIIEPHQQSSSREVLPPSLTTTTTTTTASELPVKSSAIKDTSVFSRVNIDIFKERNFQKSAENLPRPEKQLDVTTENITPIIEPYQQSSPSESLPPSLTPTTTKTTTVSESPVKSSAIKDTSIFSRVNIDIFKERNFEKTAENLPQPSEQLDVTIEKIMPIIEPHQQTSPSEPVPPSLTTTTTTTTASESPVKSSAIKDTSVFSRVNIDTFKERTFPKPSEAPPKPEEHLEVTDQNIVSPPEESHYELPTNEPVQPPMVAIKTIESTTKDSSIFSQVNIDAFKERTFDKDFKNLPKSEERPDITNATLTSSLEESHYELPKNEPIEPQILSRKTFESIPKDSSVFSQVNIDTFKERTFEKSPKDFSKPEVYSDIIVEKVISGEEPHYQLPSSEPVPLPIIPIENEYATVDRNTYDVPRTIELQQTVSPIEIKTDAKTTNEPMIPSTIDIQKSSGDFLSTKTVEEKLKSVEVSPIITDIVPSTNIKEAKTEQSSTIAKKTKKSKATKPKTEKKSGVFSTFFHHNKQKSKIPALDLPPVERDLSSNTQLYPTHQPDTDPLHVPATNLPKPDIPLPTYDRPEVNMKTGQIKQTSEFTIPAIDLTSESNFNLPEDKKQIIGTKSDPMKIPNLQLPHIQFTIDEQKINNLPDIEIKTKVKEIPVTRIIEKDLTLTSPVEDTLNIQNDQQNIPIETNDTIQTKIIIPKLSSDQTEILNKPELSLIEQKITITEINIDQLSKPSVIVEKKTSPDNNIQLPSIEPVVTISKTSTSSSPSFDNNVPTKVVSTVKSSEKQLIETKAEPTKKSSKSSLCSCFSNKSASSKDKTRSIQAPKTNLPEVNIPVSSSNISSTLKTQGSLRAPSNDLPPVDLTPTSIEPIVLPTIHIQDKKQPINQPETIVPLNEIKKQKEIQMSLPIQAPLLEKQLGDEKKVQTNISTVAIETQPVKETQTVSTESKKSSSSSFEIKAPILNIPELNLSSPSKIDAYQSFTKQEESTSIPEQIQSRSDSGLEAIISSHIHPSSTFDTMTTMEDVQQHPSISSGLGSEILDKHTIKSSTSSDIQMIQPSVISKKEEISLTKNDFIHKITMNDETRSKLIFRQDQLKKCLENEIAKSIIDFDPKKDHKPLEKILIHAIDLIKDQKVTTYPELQQKLTVEHKHQAFIVDPVVRSLYCTIEKEGLDNIDKPEFPLAIRDMVRLPAKQTFDTVTHLNKEEMPLATTQMTNETRSPHLDVSIPSEASITIEKKSSEQTKKPIDDKTRSCLTCGRSKSKTKLSSSSTTTSINSLLDERRRLQLNTHRQELGTVLHEHIQSSQPPIRKFDEHSKEAEKIIRRSLVLVTHPKIQSYEQIRNDLKIEYKQTFYLIDPIVDIVRDTFNHCDIVQMNEKTNINILNSNISQTANLYNNQINLLTTQEYNLLKSNQLSWLQSYLIDNETKEKKLTRKQIKELNKILQRSLEILSTNLISTWDELLLQLQREYSKTHDLCIRSIELLKQSHRDGLFLLQQAPSEEKRRLSFLLSERARQNLKTNRSKVILSLKNLLINHNKLSNDNKQLDIYLNKTFSYLEEQKQGQFKTYNDLKQRLKQDFKNNNQDYLIEQIVDIIEQAHATNQFDDIDKPEVQTLMKDRLEGKPLIIKEMYVSLPPRIGVTKFSNDESSRYLLTSVNGDRTLTNTTSSHSIGRGLSWREANERARILFYRGKHPAIHYDEQADAFDVRMLLETASGGTQEIPVTDTDIHELLNSCGVQWDGVNIISLVDHSEDVVRAAEQAALRVIREKGIFDLRVPPSTTTNVDIHDDDHNVSVVSPDATTSSS
ncbi:unnamed protein product [Rotaria sp. Silwood1]|nr:unnamed protein product [Rotaria sp. Silwood1]